MISLRNPIWLTALTVASVGFMLAACGGNVVVDQGSGATTGAVVGGFGGLGGFGGFGGDGGIGGIGGGVGGVGGIGGAGGCDGLQADFDAKLASAQACNPALATIQCSGKVTAIDACGCEVVANDQSASSAKTAIAAFDAWAGSGCGPFDCYACPPPPSSPWYCDPTAGECMPAWEK